MYAIFAELLDCAPVDGVRRAAAIAALIADCCQPHVDRVLANRRSAAGNADDVGLASLHGECELVAHDLPDAVLLDMRLPRCDGPTTIAAIRRNPAYTSYELRPLVRWQIARPQVEPVEGAGHGVRAGRQ